MYVYRCVSIKKLSEKTLALKDYENSLYRRKQ